MNIRKGYRSSMKSVSLGILCLIAFVPRSTAQEDPIKAKLLSDPNFMKAISYAVDRQAFVDNVLKGNAIPATVQAPAATAVSGINGKNWGDISPNFGVYHPESADPEKSKAYLAKALENAGLSSVDEIPEFVLLTREDQL